MDKKQGERGHDFSFYAACCRSVKREIPRLVGDEPPLLQKGESVVEPMLKKGEGAKYG